MAGKKKPSEMSTGELVSRYKGLEDKQRGIGNRLTKEENDEFESLGQESKKRLKDVNSHKWKGVQK